jgi:hypothetical protein
MVDEVDSVDGQGRWDGWDECANVCRPERVEVRPRFICNLQIMGRIFSDFEKKCYSLEE